MRRIKYKYANIAEARRELAEWVIISYSRRARGWWRAEIGNDAYYGKTLDDLVATMLRDGKRVAILRQHRDGTITATLMEG